MQVRCWLLEHWDDVAYRARPPVVREIDPEAEVTHVSPHAHPAHPDWKVRLKDGSVIAVEALADVGVRSARPAW